MGIRGKKQKHRCIHTHIYIERGIYGNSIAAKRKPGLHPAPKKQIRDIQTPAEAATTCPLTCIF